MGYCIDMRGCSNFKIKAENFQKALKAIQDLHGKETIKDSGGRHFSWIRHDFYKINTLVEMMDEWGWPMEIDAEGNCNRVYCSSEKLGDDEILMKAIAPFVEPGGEIEMEGEDGTRWKWVFNGKTCVERTGTVVYDED